MTTLTCLLCGYAWKPRKSKAGADPPARCPKCKNHYYDKPRTYSCPPHYWLIAPAHGPTSPGICNQCGVRRDFSNFPDAAEQGQWTRHPIPEEKDAGI